MNQAVLNGAAAANLLIGKDSPGQIAHNLVHLDQDLPSTLRVKSNRLNVGVDLAPLLRSVSADFCKPTDKTALKRLRSSHAGRYEGEGCVNVAPVEDCIRCT